MHKIQKTIYFVALCLRNSDVWCYETRQDKTRWLDNDKVSDCYIFCISVQRGHVLVVYWSHAITWYDFAGQSFQKQRHVKLVAFVWMVVYGGKNAVWPWLNQYCMCADIMLPCLDLHTAWWLSVSCSSAHWLFSGSPWLSSTGHLSPPEDSETKSFTFSKK